MSENFRPKSLGYIKYGTRTGVAKLMFDQLNRGGDFPMDADHSTRVSVLGMMAVQERS